MKLKDIRQSKGYTQSQIAKKLNIKQSTYSLKENNKRDFSIEELLLLEELFNIPIKELVKAIKES